MSALPREDGDEFALLCDAVLQLTGIDLSMYRRGQMERRVRTFATQRGEQLLSRYVRMLQTDPDELDALLDRVTINVSQLWRNPEQWQMLERTVLPELAAAGPIRAWSAGCSYGAEAYTLAAICHETLPAARVMITGTDVDRRMVDRARKGVFSDDDARSAPAERMGKAFERAAGSWIVRPELLRMTRFEAGDLLTMRPRLRAYDLVLCRNTVIYFNEAVRDELHARLADSLRPGGYLVVGATERVAAPERCGLTLVRPFTYRKS